MHRKIPALESLFHKVAGIQRATLSTKRTPVQIFQYEFCKILKRVFKIYHLTTASERALDFTKILGKLLSTSTNLLLADPGRGGKKLVQVRNIVHHFYLSYFRRFQEYVTKIVLVKACVLMGPIIIVFQQFTYHWLVYTSQQGKQFSFDHILCSYIFPFTLKSLYLS